MTLTVTYLNHGNGKRAIVGGSHGGQVVVESPHPNPFLCVLAQGVCSSPSKGPQL